MKTTVMGLLLAIFRLLVENVEREILTHVEEGVSSSACPCGVY